MIHVLDHQCKVDGGKLTAVKTHVLKTARINDRGVARGGGWVLRCP